MRSSGTAGRRSMSCRPDSSDSVGGEPSEIDRSPDGPGSGTPADLSRTRRVGDNEWHGPLGDPDMRRIRASMAISQLEQMPRVGYWWSPAEPDLPHPEDFVDESWD